MADEENTEPQKEDLQEQQVPREEDSEPPTPEIRMELVDGLPGNRAVAGVEQDGCFTWLADKHHVSEQARDEFVETLTLIVRQRSWVQNWPGAS